MDNLSLGVILAQLINFWILFFAFKYFLWDKLADAIDERKNKLEKINNIDSEIEAKKAEIKAEEEKVLSEARKKADSIIETANNASKKRSEEMISKAEKEAEWIIASGKSEIEKEKLSMMNWVKENIVDLALRLNKKLFDKEAVNKDFLEKELSKIN